MRNTLPFSLILLAIAATACNVATEAEPRVGGESHFLQCDGLTTCEIGECVCGFCTTSCESDSDCGPGAECRRGEPTCGTNVCVETCSASCPEGLDCVEGQCTGEGAFLCDGLFRIEGQGEDWRLYSGASPLPEGLACAPELSGPHCDAERGIFWVMEFVEEGSAVEATKTWCASLEKISDASAPMNSPDNPTGPEDDSGITPSAGGLLVENNSAIIGAGVGLTELDGDVQVKGPNVRLAGMTINGDLVADEGATDLLLLNVYVRGTARLLGNRTSLIGSNFDAAVEIGEKAIIVDSSFASEPVAQGTPDVCIENGVGEDDERPQFCD